MFNNFTQKEINRGNYLEAVDFYRGVTLASLVEALRIKHYPVHYDFRMRYIHYELPSEVLKRLRHLFFVENEKKLQEKYLEATDWFHEILSTIDQNEIKRSIGQ
jgi:hypothetical protein